MTEIAQETEAEKKLRELKAQRAQLVAARETRTAELEVEREIEREERAIADEQALQRAIDEHGPVGTHLAVVETSLGNIIVKRASAMKFRRFQDKGDATSQDVEALVRPCVVHPSQAQLDVIFEELPATNVRLASAVIALAGQRSDELVKK